MEENGEDSHAMQTEENVEELKESHDAGLEDGQKNGKASSKMRGKKKGSSGSQVTPKKAESKALITPVTPASDRPARERKIIDRFADSVEKEKEKPKDFKIEQGAGTCLKDIPNVVFKLSKRKKSDESVQLLHKLLYNKRVKPHLVKANILQFSGCVWGPNEEKEKAKLKDKLDKCLKDDLYQVCDLLDLKSITKTTKKEDMVLRVLEFLDSPYKTTDKLLQEEQQKSKEKKRKSSHSKGKRKSASQTPRKRQKREANEHEEQDSDENEEKENAQEEQEEEPEEEEPEAEPEEVPVKKKKSIKIKEPSRDAKPSSAKKQGKKSAKKESESEDGEEDPVEEPAVEAEEPEEPAEEPKRKRAKNKKYEDDVAPKSPKKVVQKSDDASKSPKKSTQKSVKKKSVYEPGEEDLDDDTTGVKSKPLSKVSKKSSPPKEDVAPVKKEKKQVGTSSTKVSAKKKSKEEEAEDDAPPAPKVPKKARGANNSEAKEEAKSESIPPDEDLRAAICELLRDADFSTVTFTDVVKQLGAKFNVDLSQNKAHVKNLIQEEISKIVDEDDGDGDEDEEETGVHTPEKKEKESIVAEGQ